VLSSRSPCEQLITRPEDSYRLWFVVVCDIKISRMRRPNFALGRSATGKKLFYEHIISHFEFSFVSYIRFVLCVLIFNLVKLCIFMLCYVFLLLCMFCSVLDILFYCVFYVLVVCKCVPYYSHRVSTQLQLTNISYINRYTKKPSITTKHYYYLLHNATSFDPTMGSSSGKVYRTGSRKALPCTFHFSNFLFFT
jgi:hypothetical protein